MFALLAGAIPLGAVVALLALALLDLIALITHLAYTGTISTTLGPPDTSVLGPLSVLVPVAGGLIVGLMARYGSERIRGHGIPEAMETILLRGSRMEPRLAVLKPISSAVSIGTGGPFGAEGPIIVTGGATGSILGQLLHLTAAERRCLLVAGAAAGMTAVFGTPVAAVLLAVELLLFEWRPRSMIPVALAACAAEATREALANAGLLHKAPLFAVSAHATLAPSVSGGALLIGLACGGLAWVMTRCVYGAEDLFARLPLHWSWWPAIGGLVVGIGGLIEPRALGVGYNTIGAELAGTLALSTLAVLLVVKLTIWATALGSNTSGGILAPLLMLGAALGGLLGAILPGATEGTWAMIGMAAAMAGVMRSPFTSIVFAARADPRHRGAPATPRSLHDRASHQRLDTAALDPDREDRPPRLPRHPRVRSRPAARAARPRRHANRRSHGRSRLNRRRPLRAAPRGLRATPPTPLPGPRQRRAPPRSARALRHSRPAEQHILRRRHGTQPTRRKAR